MLYAVMPEDDYKNACDKIREHTGKSRLITSGELEDEIEDVHKAGKALGEKNGYSNGYTDGKTAGVAEGISMTNSATATENKVAEGETFWAGGKELTGNVKVASGGISQVVTPTVAYIGSEECVGMNHTPIERLFINPNLGGITLKAPYSAFGDAEANDVTKGKIFTSKSGLRVPGTGKTYDEAYNEGAEQVNRTLYGAYILKESIDLRGFVDKYETFVEDFTGKGVYMHFYDIFGGYSYEPVGKMQTWSGTHESEPPYVLYFYSTCGEDGSTGFVTYAAIDPPDYDDGVSLQYWSSEIGDWYDGELSVYNGDSAPAQSRFIIFTKPLVVSQTIYDIFTEITDNSAAVVADEKALGVIQEKRRFWGNAINAAKNNFERAFATSIWTNATFQPTQSMYVTNAANMFGDSYVSTYWRCSITDLFAALATHNAKIIFNTDGLSETFYYVTSLTKIGGLQYNKDITYFYYTFAGCSKLREIVEPIRINSTTTFYSAFGGCSALEEVRFIGVIGQNGLDFKSSPKLSKASWQNIIGCLSGDTTGLSINGSLASVNKAFETSVGANDGSTSEEWLNLIATKSNWTISLV